MRQKKTAVGQNHLLLEILVAGFLFCIMAVLRFSYIHDYITAAYGDTRFLEMALIRKDAALPYLSELLSNLYAQGLQLVFWLAGNKELAAVYAQAVLQILTLVLLYFAYRKLCGILFAAVVFLAAMLQSRGLWLLGELTPGNLLLLFISLYLFVFACELRMEEAAAGRGLFFGLIPSGLLCGFLIAADSSGFAVLLISVLCIALFCRWPFGFLGGAGIGTVLTFLIKSMYYGFSMADPYEEYYQNYYLTGMLNPFTRFGLSSIVLAIVLGFFAAGCLLHRIISLVQEKAKAKAAKKQPSTRIPDISVVEVENLPVPKVCTVSCEETEEKEQDKPAIKFIENPLPVPKRHVKKEMTYAFEPDEAHMCFDLEDLPEHADYDIE